MVFSSLEFLFIFMPVFFLFYFAVPYKLRNAVLLFGSFAFYLAGTIKYPAHLIVFTAIIILDYFLARLMETYKSKKKILLLMGIAVNLLNLGFFKYFPFIIAEAEKIIPSFNLNTNIVLPIGISFYTFQSISYLADVYKGKITAEKSLLKYAVYISMFEQLIAGPIVKYSDVSENLNQRRIKKETVLNGLGIFIFGLGLKVLLANPWVNRGQTYIISALKAFQHRLHGWVCLHFQFRYILIFSGIL